MISKSKTKKYPKPNEGVSKRILVRESKLKGRLAERSHSILTRGRTMSELARPSLAVERDSVGILMHEFSKKSNTRPFAESGITQSEVNKFVENLSTLLREKMRCYCDPFYFAKDRTILISRVKSLRNALPKDKWRRTLLSLETSGDRGFVDRLEGELKNFEKVLKESKENKKSGNLRGVGEKDKMRRDLQNAIEELINDSFGTKLKQKRSLLLKIMKMDNVSAVGGYDPMEIKKTSVVR